MTFLKHLATQSPALDPSATGGLHKFPPRQGWRLKQRHLLGPWRGTGHHEKTQIQRKKGNGAMVQLCGCRLPRSICNLLGQMEPVSPMV